MAIRCSVCKAPIHSTFERDQGKCTACLHKENPGDVDRAKQDESGRNPDPNKGTLIDPQGTLDTQAKTVLVGCKVSVAFRAKLDAEVGRLGVTKGEFLRSLLEKALS